MTDVTVPDQVPGRGEDGGQVGGEQVGFFQGQEVLAAGRPVPLPDVGVAAGMNGRTARRITSSSRGHATAAWRNAEVTARRKTGADRF